MRSGKMYMALMSIVSLTGKRWQSGSYRQSAKGKGIDTAGMTGVDYQTFKETQYDILAAELRKSIWIWTAFIGYWRKESEYEGRIRKCPADGD